MAAGVLCGEFERISGVMTKKQDSKGRYIIIDILKILFAYLIMLHHIILQHDISNGVTKAISYFISLAVPYFFVVSGYFLFSKISNNYNMKSLIIKEYSKKIIIMYAIWTMVMLPFRISDVLSIGFNLKEQVIYWLKYIRIVLFIGEYQLWYLLGIIQALIIFWICNKKNDLKVCIVFAGAFYLVKIVIEYFSEVINGNMILKSIFNMYNILFGTTRNGIFVGFIYIIIGCIFVKIKNKRNPMIIGILLIFTLISGYLLNVSNYIILAEIFKTISVILLFEFSIQITVLKGGLVLRNISTLIYALHMAVILFLEICIGLDNIFIEFILSIIVTTIISLFIIKLSKKMEILRYIY